MPGQYILLWTMAIRLEKNLYGGGIICMSMAVQIARFLSPFSKLRRSNMSVDEALSRATLSVPEAGLVFYGLCRNSSYEAAKRGDIPTIRIGRKIVVPVAPVAQALGLKINLSGGV